MTTIGITMGCPVGIGPEIILKYLRSTTPKEFTPVVIGDINLLRYYSKTLDLPISITEWKPGIEPKPDEMLVHSITSLDPQSLEWGKPDGITGKAMAQYITEAVDLTQQNQIDGITTGPISKVALKMGGYSYPGHTEMLADLTNQSHFSMMMAGSSLKVTLVTIHCAYKEVTGLLTTAKIVEQITIANNSLINDFGINNPRVAVAGLNPHSGEEGRFGTEELDIIEPAIEEARKKNIIATGPYPPDTLFYKASRGEFDVVVCMYHDQGLIPFKLLHFEDGVNVTIGLPIVRTSVDHGTAYDIAGQNIASHDSLRAAVELAAHIAHNRKKN